MWWRSLRDELESIAIAKIAAELTTQLMPHQKRVQERLKKSPGLIVAHGLGSGKTLSSIAAAVEANGATAAVPASLRANYEKEIAKHVSGDPNIDVVSLQRSALTGEVPLPESGLLIVDEAHRARDPRSKTFRVLRGTPAEKRLLLTGSPVYNRPEDIAPLVNIAAGGEKDVLPMGTDFRHRYVQEPGQSVLDLIPFVHTRASLKRKGELRSKVAPWVDYYADAESSDYPSTKETRVAVPMTKDQSKLHAAAWGQLPAWARAKIRAGLPPTKSELAAINQFEAQTRQISGSMRNYVQEGGPTTPTPKIQRAYEDFMKQYEGNPQHKALIYSNYKAPLVDYKTLLEEKGVPYAEFTGDQTMTERKKIVEGYNAGQIKALLVTSAGGEGLDLKGTRQVQILEPHWNEEKVKQVIGRAVRMGSHTDLPEDQRHVDVQRYVSHPVGFLNMKKPGIEPYLATMSVDKDRLNKQMIEIMKRGQ
jgi:SNF2 family DNA or RNA helicase